jgi:tetratricopeptide (TPR) repeat protein
VERDPSYALAYAGLADAHNKLGAWNAAAPRESFPAAREAAAAALRLDEGLAEAHTQMAVVKFLYDWDFAGAEAEFRRAIELNRSYSDAHQWYANYLSAVGRAEEALAEMRRAQELDPVSLEKTAGVGDMFYQQRRFDLALEQYRRAAEMDPNSGFAHWLLGNVYTQKGLYEEAVAEYEKSIPLSGDSPDELASLGYAYALAGRRREAEGVIEELRRRSERSYISPTVIAFVYAGLGENDRAFEQLERAYEGRDFILVLLNADPTFDRLRPDPRFAQLARRVGLPQ